MYESETSRFRDKMLKFCEGYGIDIGYGGDPIKPSAITIDYPQGDIAHCGDHPMNLGGDARKLKWFRDNVLDYVYSSHCLEDFENTKEVLEEWLRTLKKGGKLVLLLPDQQRYEAVCKKHNLEPNAAHKIKDFSLYYIKKQLEEIPFIKIIHEEDYLDDYNFLLVVEKIKETMPRCLNCVELQKKINDKKLYNMMPSLHWKIPNYFYKLYKKIVG